MGFSMNKLPSLCLSALCALLLSAMAGPVFAQVEIVDAAGKGGAVLRSIGKLSGWGLGRPIRNSSARTHFIWRIVYSQ